MSKKHKQMSRFKAPAEEVRAGGEVMFGEQTENTGKEAC